MRSLLEIASIHKLTIISIDFVFAFTQADLDVDLFMDIHLGMGFDGNRGECVLKLKNHFMDLIKKVQIGLIF